MKDLQTEREKLSETVKTIHEVLETEREEYEELYDEIVGKKEELWPMLERKRTHIMNLETSIDNPYFARVDFNSYDDEKTNRIYIGKNGVMKDAEIIITDWRAPINNASEEIYSSENKLDMKLLYVAITRTLHKLDIIYTNEITMPLIKYKN